MTLTLNRWSWPKYRRLQIEHVQQNWNRCHQILKFEFLLPWSWYSNLIYMLGWPTNIQNEVNRSIIPKVNSWKQTHRYTDTYKTLTLMLLPTIVNIALTISIVWTRVWLEVWGYDICAPKHENISKVWISHFEKIHRLIHVLSQSNNLI